MPQCFLSTPSIAQFQSIIVTVVCLIRRFLNRTLKQLQVALSLVLGLNNFLTVTIMLNRCLSQGTSHTPAFAKHLCRKIDLLMNATDVTQAGGVAVETRHISMTIFLRTVIVDGESIVQDP